MWHKVVLSLFVMVAVFSESSSAGVPYKLPGKFHMRHLHQPAETFKVPPYSAATQPSNHNDSEPKWENERQTFEFDDVKFNGDQLDIGKWKMEISYDNARKHVLGFPTVIEKPKFFFIRRGGGPFLPLDYMLPGVHFYFHYDETGRPVWSEQERELNVKHLRAALTEYFNRENRKQLHDLLVVQESYLNENHKTVAHAAFADWVSSRHELLYEKAAEHIVNFLSRPDIMDQLFARVFKYFPAPPLYGTQEFDLVLERAREHKGWRAGATDEIASWRIRNANMDREWEDCAGEPVTKGVMEHPDQAYLMADTDAFKAILHRYLLSLAERNQMQKDLALPQGVRFISGGLAFDLPNEALVAIGKMYKNDPFAAKLAQEKHQLHLSVVEEPTIRFSYLQDKLGGDSEFVDLTINFALKRASDPNEIGTPVDLTLLYSMNSSGVLTPRGIYPGGNSIKDFGQPAVASYVASPLGESLKFAISKMFIDSTQEALAKAASDPAKKGTAIVAVRSTACTKVDRDATGKSRDNRDILIVTFRVDPNAQKDPVVPGVPAAAALP